MARITQRLDATELPPPAIPAAVAAQLGALGIAGRVAGRSVAIAVGSRGIANLVTIVRAVVDVVRVAGGAPFVFPAMGSHGGATAEGQRALLASLGVVEEAIGCPVVSEAETVLVGTTAAGVPIHFDRRAAQAEAIIVVNRVKPHTHFRGKVESGLCKMLAIGCGKHPQAQAIHARATEGLVKDVPEVASAIIARLPVVAGVAVLENGHHRVHRVVAVAGADILAREAELLIEARGMLPRLPVDELDLLIVERIGKDISGTGMDTNVVGRCRLLDFPGFPTPRIAVIIALDLSDLTHGNATGMGLADLVTRRLADKIDWPTTYMNCLSGYMPQLAAMPIVLASDREAVRTALDRFIGPDAATRARVARIRDTLSLADFEVSANMREVVAARAGVEWHGPAREMSFDSAGRLI